jgi:hypothetical protein
MQHTTYIGIDFSINSPGITIQHQGVTQWIHISRKTASRFDDITSTLGHVPELFQYKTDSIRTGRNAKLVSYVDREETTVKDMVEYVDFITNAIWNLAPATAAIIGIEGLAFGSKSSSLADIAAYHGHLRAQLYKTGPKNATRVLTWSPLAVKSFTGGGRFKKWDMVDAFLRHSNPLSDAIQSCKSVLSKEKSEHTEWSAPIYDLVDSWWVLQKTLSV